MKAPAYRRSRYLIVASPWSYYGMSNCWAADSFPVYPELSKPLGVPLGPAKVLGGGKYTREFEHVRVALDTASKQANVTWKTTSY